MNRIRAGRPSEIAQDREVMMPRIRSARRFAILTLVLAFAACAAPGPPGPPPAGSDMARDQGRDQPILEHLAECSAVEARQPIFRVRWPVPAAATGVFIEVSPYKDGFTTGRFVSAAAGDPRAVTSSGVLLRAPEVQAQAAQPPSPLAIRLVSLRFVKDGTQIEAVLAGLNPGVNYYVRVRGIPGETIRVQAPICPVDYVETPRESPK